MKYRKSAGGEIFFSKDGRFIRWHSTQELLQPKVRESLKIIAAGHATGRPRVDSAAGSCKEDSLSSAYAEWGNHSKCSRTRLSERHSLSPSQALAAG